MITGLRMNHAYIRPGGVVQDLPRGAIDKIREALPLIRRGIGELELLLNENPLVKGAWSTSATSTSPAAWP